MGNLFGKAETSAPAPQPRSNPYSSSSYYTSSRARQPTTDYSSGYRRSESDTFARSYSTRAAPANPAPRSSAAARPAPTTSTYSSRPTSGLFYGASSSTSYSNGYTTPASTREVDELASSFGAVSVKESGAVPVYVIGLTNELVCIFEPAREKIIEIPRNKVALGNLEVGRVYHTKIAGDVISGFSALSALCDKYYAHRANYEFSVARYKELVVPALLLGSRVRDFEQRAAVVTRLYSLILTMPFQQGKLTMLKLKTTTGDTIDVRVKWVDRPKEETNEKQIRVGGDPIAKLPACVKTGSLLQLVAARDKEPIVTAVLARLYAGSLTIQNSTLIDCIYGEPCSKTYPSVAHAPTPFIQMKTLERVMLNAEQAEAVARYNSDCPAFVVESPPGSGKTMTAAAMAVSYTGSGVQLFLSTANVPVFNMALALAKLNYGSRTAIHFVSAEREELMTEETRSPFSVLCLAKQKNFLEAKIALLEARLEAATSDEDKKKLKDAIRGACGPVLYDNYDIMFATVDMILGRLNKPKHSGRPDNIKKQLTSSVTRVVVDEASQLTESALTALIHSFPKAQIVLIGDSKQLPPFKYTKEDLVSELAARSALDVAKRKGNLPVIRLLKVYRASPLLMKHYSDVFYAGSLVSAKPESAHNPLSSFGRRAGGSRCLFWSVKGASKQNGTSKINDKEIAALVTVVNHLRGAGYDEKSVMIISYYEAQRKLVEGQLPEGYEVLTVDSAQGREKKIVIVLTTRTSVPTENAGFFTCRLRCNVALSRHQEALIVIGHPHIAAAQPWHHVLDQKYFKHVVE
ncbi:hypothetical protein PFISCL1PPCAC_7577 [Pristionchus fissidentatus]|uniref:DNA2/NAM7 helicase-like C-terminal domain-containing protein n=1 Tax=Pristionchus fissidentatus TaxID=1538716 RepID=A0AAV5V9H0_9BILA|nr:hypothetical protein PFISCL1PPCAC_7577 [Pristionchus fissidentatus]